MLMLSATAHAYCFDSAGREFGIDPRLLWAIAKVESNFDAHAVGLDGKDIGLMQVRTIHITDLATRFGVRISKQDLFDPCFNVRMGAWVLATRIGRYGPTWEAVGSYNAKSRDKRDDYIRKVWMAYGASQ